LELARNSYHNGFLNNITIAHAHETLATIQVIGEQRIKDFD